MLRSPIRPRGEPSCPCHTIHSPRRSSAPPRWLRPPLPRRVREVLEELYALLADELARQLERMLVEYEQQLFRLADQAPQRGHARRCISRRCGRYARTVPTWCRRFLVGLESSLSRIRDPTESTVADGRGSPPGIPRPAPARRRGGHRGHRDPRHGHAPGVAREPAVAVAGPAFRRACRRAGLRCRDACRSARTSSAGSCQQASGVLQIGTDAQAGADGHVRTPRAGWLRTVDRDDERAAGPA